uniref:Cytochrome P450 family 4 subfamily F member 2 n=1 Tax=Chinchilla lanigera TaxID=34839 RepID=A0A8C2VEF8_CHILA
MAQLSLSWLGLGPAATSPWLFLLLVGASWLLAFYENSHCLRCFLIPQYGTGSWASWVPPAEQGLKYMAQLVAPYPQGCMMWMGPMMPMVILCHPDDIQCALSASAEVAPKDFYNFLKPCPGDGLLLSAGDKWSRHRRMLTPAFHFNIPKPYVKIFNDSTNVMHANWQHLVSQGSTCLDMFEHISLMTLDSLQKCLFSPFMPSPCRKPSRYISAILELNALVAKRHQKLLLHVDFLCHLTSDGQCFRKACRLVHDFTGARHCTLSGQGIDDFLKAKAKSKTLDFIDVLLLSNDEDGKELSDEDIRAEADTFMFEGERGYGSLHPGTLWAHDALRRHPEYQKRCRQEVRELLRGREPEEIGWEDLAQLPFLTMRLKESLRLHPPVIAVSGCCTQDTVLPDGRVIPKDAHIIRGRRLLGRHECPSDPRASSLREQQAQVTLAFIPFSAGPGEGGGCLSWGWTFAMAEMKVALALTLLHNTEPRRKPELILRAEGGLWLRLEPLSAGAQ